MLPTLAGPSGTHCGLLCTPAREDEGTILYRDNVITIEMQKELIYQHKASAYSTVEKLTADPVIMCTGALGFLYGVS